MFKDSDAEERLCQRLKMVVEEFGPENVRVHVPKTWFSNAETRERFASYRSPDGSYGLSPQCKLFFSTHNDIRVEVRIGEKVVLFYNEELAS